MKIVVVENKDLFEKILFFNKEDQIYFYTMGHLWCREAFGIRNADELSAYDVIIMEAEQEVAEKLRRLIVYFKSDSLVMARYNYNDFYNPIGYYQVTMVNESFGLAKNNYGPQPGVAAYNAAMEKVETLGLRL